MTEEERIKRFETTYNRIDHALAEMLGNSTNRRKHTFATKVRIVASRQRRMAKYADFLTEIGELRNALVHSRTDEDHYIAVPSEETVLELERIEKHLFSPERVVPRFEKKVVTLSPDQSLADVLDLIRDDGYSRYPVYANEGFVGLLTSNGIARWAAGHVKQHRLEIDLSSVKLSDVLEQDHRRDCVAFVSRDVLIDDVDDLFTQEKHLEAVLITPGGKPHEKPIGMVCAPDVASRSK
jgi:predicted transcriptional regulator